MKVEEIRIGNIININGEIRPITAKEIYGIANGSCFDERPIKITDKWLIKLGFDYCICKDEIEGCIYEPDKNKIGLIYINSGQIRIHQYGEEIGILFDEDDYLKYVHQLQNIYFSLTGKELEVLS